MKNYEKNAFYKIFLGYFISVTIFILLLGFLYFQQHRNIILQKTAMDMHQYLLQQKDKSFKYQQDGYSLSISDVSKVKKQLPKKDGNIYYKAFSNRYIVNIDAKIVDYKIQSLKRFTIILQIFLIALFSIISYILAKRSLKPMVDTISHLDRFIGDLIHDINTPIASIILNTKMLKKDITDSGKKKLKRIEDSANNITALYENLEILLNKKVVKKSDIYLDRIINELVETYKSIYPNIIFEIDIQNEKYTTSEIAISRILNNIISNSCKYSVYNNPSIKIVSKNGILIVEDNGKGIKYPNSVFERNYTECDSGRGIGMHIVYRLCSELGHKISIISKENHGTKVIIEF